MTSPFPFAVREHNLPAAHIREYARATSNSQDEELRLHVRQYTPVDNPEPQKGDITIIGAHANGFPKELYEPLWEDLHHKLKATGTRIRTIYILDAAWQGQSGILNADSLGNDPSWLDYTRDMQHAINLLRPPRPLVGVGHSFGATALVNLAASHPRLQAALVLLDPTYTRYVAFPSSGAVFQPAGASIVRRDAWPSRAEAERAFRRNPFYASWDERVFRRWMDFGIRDAGSDSDDSKDKGEGNGKVVLSTTKHQEVFTYLRPSWPAYDAAGETLVDPSPVPDLDPTLQADGAPTYPFYRPEGASTVSRLPGLRPPALHVFGGRSMLSAPEFRRQKMELTGAGLGGSGGAARGRVAEVVGEPYGHLIPMEAPGFCADAAAGWIAERVAEWRAEEGEYEAWARGSQEEKTTLSAEFIKYTGVKLRDGAATQGRTDKPKPKI